MYKTINKTRLIQGSIFLSCLAIVGCKSDLNQAGIDTETSNTPNQLIFEEATAGFKIERRNLVDNPSSLNDVELLYIRNNTRADRVTQIDSQPVTGLSVDGQAEVKIVSVYDLTGTIEDPKIQSEIELLCAEKTAEAILLLPEGFVGEPDVDCSADALAVQVSEQPTDISGLGKFKYGFSQSIDVNSEDLLGKAMDPTQAPSFVGKSSIVNVLFDLNDDDWSKVIRGRISVAGQESEFTVITEDRNPNMTPPSSTFFGFGRINLIPGTSYTTPSLVLNGYNTKAELLFEKDSRNPNYKLEVKIGADDFVEYTNQVFKVEDGQAVLARVTTSDEFSASYVTKAIVRDNPLKDTDGANVYETSFSVSNHSADFVPGPNTSFDFPPASSATTSDTITVKGVSAISDFQASYSAEGTTIEGDSLSVTKVLLYAIDDPSIPRSEYEEFNLIQELTLENGGLKLAPYRDGVLSSDDNQQILPAYEWSHNVTLAEGVNYLSAVAVSNIKRAGVFGESDPVVVRVEQSQEITTYPPAAKFTVLEDIRDITIDNRQNPATLVLADATYNDENGPSNHGIIWKYVLNGESKPTCSALVNTFGGQAVAGVQFNHYKPHLGGVYISTYQGRSTYFSDERLQGDLSSVQLTERALRTEAEGPQLPGHAAFRADGSRIYFSTQSRPSYDSDKQAFVSEVELIDDGTKVTSVKINSYGDSFEANYTGGIANETANPIELNNGFSIDIYSLPDGDEFILSLDGKRNGLSTDTDPVNRDNDGETLLRKIKVADTYSPLNSHEEITLVDDGGGTIFLESARAVAVDDLRGFAYISDSENDVIWKVDLSNIKTSNTLQATRLAANFIDSSQPKFANITSMVVEGGLNMIIASDSGSIEAGINPSILAFDLDTGERTFLLKALKRKSRLPTGTICEQ